MKEPPVLPAELRAEVVDLLAELLLAHANRAARSVPLGGTTVTTPPPSELASLAENRLDG
jgi:hypothetical protein